MTLKDTFPPLFCHLRYNKHKSDSSPLNVSDIDTYPFLLVYPSTSFWQALDYNSKFGCLIHWKKFVCVTQKFLFFRFLTLLYDFYLELEYSFLLLNYYILHEKYNNMTFIIRVERITFQKTIKGTLSSYYEILVQGISSASSIYSQWKVNCAPRETNFEKKVGIEISYVASMFQKVDIITVINFILRSA